MGDVKILNSSTSIRKWATVTSVNANLAQKKMQVSDTTARKGTRVFGSMREAGLELPNVKRRLLNTQSDHGNAIRERHEHDKEH